MNIFNTFYHCSNKEVVRTNGTKRLDLCAQMKFREKENKQASHDSCSKTPTYITFERRKGTYTGCSVAQASHEGSYHESCLIAVKILNHAITVISFPCDRYRDMVKYRDTEYVLRSAT